MKHTFVTLTRVEDESPAVEVINDITNYEWLSYMFDHSHIWQGHQQETAIKTFVEEDSQQCQFGEIVYTEELLNEFKGKIKEIVGEDEMEFDGSVLYVTWGVEYDYQLTAIISENE